jgi:hypothetical protein
MGKYQLLGGFLRRCTDSEIPMTVNQVETQADDKLTEKMHPIFGCLKGTVTLAPGVDLTDPEWGEVASTFSHCAD